MQISIDSEEDIQKLIDLVPKDMLGVIDDEPRRIFCLAIELFEGGLRCLDPWFVDDQLVSLPAPVAVVNIAFCLELFLKSQIRLEQKLTKGHNLESLFGMTSEEYRDTVARNYSNIIGRHEERLLMDVKKLATSFTDWRYIYEKNSTIKISTHLLICLAKSVFQASVAFHPEWKVRVEVLNRLNLGPSEEIAQLIVLPKGARLMLTTMAPRNQTVGGNNKNICRKSDYPISYLKNHTMR